MADYVCYVRGVLPNGRSWSTERRITSGQAPATLLTTWANAWTAAWNLATTGLNVMYDANTKITEFEVGSLNSSMRKVAKATDPVNLVGTSAGDPYSANNTVVVHWDSAVTQPYGQGNQKLPPPTEAFVDGDVLTATAGANFKAAMTSIQAAITADGSTFFVAPRRPPSRASPRSPRPCSPPSVSGSSWAPSGSGRRRSRRPTSRSGASLYRTTHFDVERRR